jgi:hypothetical protein
MKIAYKKRHLNVNLILGLVWLVWFIVVIFGKEEPNWIDYGWIFISLLYLGMYVYLKNYKYLTIENGVIKQNGWFEKKINLNEIKRIKKFAGDYILKTDNKEMTINTQIIEPTSLSELNEELEKLDVEWN